MEYISSAGLNAEDGPLPTPAADEEQTIAEAEPVPGAKADETTLEPGARDNEEPIALPVVGV